MVPGVAARVLTEAGLGTLLFDLLTPAEELDRANVFDIGLLARRLAGSPGGCAPSPARPGPLSVTSVPAREPRPRRGPRPKPGLASRPWCPAAGVPDLAHPGLAEVTAPTLLIVGGNCEPGAPSHCAA